MTSTMNDLLVADFRAAFDGQAPTHIARAPGRVNLIGEHTDYHDGFVLPMAIDRYVAVACAPRDDRRLRAFAAAYQATADVTMEGLEPRGNSHWFDYVAGVVWALREAGYHPRGIDLAIRGDLPIGAGLSSSAALEVAVARGLCDLSTIAWNPLTMAQVARRAENGFVGVGCGVMDQVTSAAGRANRALLLDCRSLALEPVPLPSAAAVVVMDTGARRTLGATEYEARREACDAALAAVRTIAPAPTALRDVDDTVLDRARARMDPVSYRRASHVVAENRRPAALAEALRAGDLAGAGHLLDASHASLRDLYDVSSRELDLITELARRAPGCFGARMTGAGFGGSAVGLVEAGAVHAFTTAVLSGYRRQVSLEASVFQVRAVDGASVEPVS